MTILIVSHPAALAHDMGAGHPERPDRYRAVAHALGAPRFADVLREDAPEAALDVIARVHPAAYVEALREAAPTHGHVALDADTRMNPGTMEAALRGAGGAVAAVDAVMTGVARAAFVAMRPPGHHAERATPMGFCFLNSAAIAARHAQAAHGASRVAIMDFDVHHGNGTQDIFWRDATVMYASTHQMPLYPGSGATNETGAHDTIVNAPLRSGDGGAAFRAAMRDLVLPRLDAFAPDLVIISAGFDAHHADPLGGLMLDETDFTWATQQLLDIAERHAGGRVVSVLEGGYDLKALATSAAAHVSALMGAG